MKKYLYILLTFLIIGCTPESEFEKYKEHVQLEPWKKDGKYILVFEPSDFAKRWWEVPNWTEDTIQLLKKNTNLEIRIRKKNSLISFESEVKGAKAVVSLQSAAAIQAHIWGIPGYCAEMSAAYPVSHSLEMIYYSTIYCIVCVR